MNQKSVFQLAMEAKKAADEEEKKKKSSSSGAAAVAGGVPGAGGAGSSQASEYNDVRESNKHKVSEYAHWCDWGHVPLPKTPPAGSTAGRKEDDTFIKNVKVFAPTDAQVGDTIEVCVCECF
jgi:hypothetical protein